MTRLRLWTAIAAAVLGVFPLKVGPTEVGLRTDEPEERWYDGRALAESAKSLAWRFSVGAMPFRAVETSA